MEKTGGNLEFTDYMLWKAGLIVLAAFIYGIWLGLHGD